MNPNEILSFLFPQFSDPLQLTFFAVILFMIGFTVVSAHRTARPASWEHKWTRGTPDDQTDDLDIEHGSVTDLWHAVATAPEKLAEIMPGMLLVVGLLGTFLGLGLALNHASSILGQADLTNAGAAADSMQNLLGLLQGLGTKFKTSTWGILGFVLLKIWSEVTRFEEKRLTWVIGKVKGELESRKRTEATAEKARQADLFANIGRVATCIVEGMSTQFATLIKSDETMHLQTLQHLDQLAQGTQGVRADLELVRAETQATRIAMVAFTEGTQHVVEGMGEAAQRMADGADKVGSGAEQLVDAIRTFESQFTEVLDNVRVDLGKAIQDMSIQARETLERGSAQLGDATREISTALGQLSKDTKETMDEVKNSIGRSLQIQERASVAFTTSNNVLNEKVTATTEIVKSMTEGIKEGLDSVASASLKMKKIAEASKQSSDTMELLVAQMDKLPAAFMPLQYLADEQKALVAVLKPLADEQKALVSALKPLADEQKALVSAIKPLAGIVEVQQATIALLQAMQVERQDPTAPAAPLVPELT